MPLAVSIIITNARASSAPLKKAISEMYKPQTYGLSLLLIAASMASALGAAPKPDYNDLPAYMKALQQSSDPQAKHILREIYNGPHALARELAAAKRAGIDFDGKEPRPTLPREQNAATVDKRIQSLLGKTHDLDLPMYADSLSSRYAYTPAQLDRVRKALAAHRDILTLIHQAAGKPRFLVVHGSGETPGSVAFLFPSFATLREEARILVTESYMMAADDNPAEAVENQSRGFRIAKQSTSSPGLDSLLVAYAVDNMTLSGMRNIMHLSGPNVDVDDAVAHTVATNHCRFSIGDALRSEAASGIEMNDWIRHLGAEDIARGMPDLAANHDSRQPRMSLTPQERNFVLDLFDAQDAAYINRMNGLVAAVSGPEPPTVRRRKELSAIDTTDPIFVITNESPWFDGLMNHADEIQASEEVTEAAAYVLALKARTGSFPSELPHKFIDPFTHASLKYRREGTGGFVVYSVGPAGRFDGGKPGDVNQPANGAYFRYPAHPVPVPLNMQ